MPRRKHDKAKPALLQESDLQGDSWHKEVVARLPKQLESQAKQLGALRRKREIQQASDLLRGLLAYVLCVSSFRHLGCWALLIGLADMSDRAWNERLRKASSWLLWLLAEVLSEPRVPCRQSEGMARVLLIDATRLRQVGGRGDDWRVHLAYDFSAGRMSQVTVTDKHTAESLGHTALQADMIVVADNGYGYRHTVAKAEQAKAKVVLRITPNSFPLEDEEGQAIDTVGWLRKQAGPTAHLRCWCSYKGQRYPLRLIARRLSAQAAKAARRRKERKARADKRRLQPETLFLAEWILLVSTLQQEEWSDAEVLRLYRARWQIELVFKRIKQLLRLHVLRAQSMHSAEATLRAVLVSWALQQEEGQLVREQLAKLDQEPQDWMEPSEATLSTWLLQTVCVDTLRQQVQGPWDAARLHHCLPHLTRFLCSRRKRPHQERDVRLWLAQRQAAASRQPSGRTEAR